jgi:hypothetical protein
LSQEKGNLQYDGKEENKRLINIVGVRTNNYSLTQSLLGKFDEYWKDIEKDGLVIKEKENLIKNFGTEEYEKVVKDKLHKRAAKIKSAKEKFIKDVNKDVINTLKKQCSNS